MSEEMNISGEQMTEAAAPVESYENNANSEQNQSRSVPLDALQAERSERQKLQDELRMLKDHVSLMSAQRMQPQVSPEKDELDSMTDDDVLTVGDFKKALSKKEREYQMSLQELKMTQKHPDYDQVIRDYLPDVLNQNPSLRQTLQSTQDYELAYYLAKNSDLYKSKNKQVKKNADAERIVQNANRSGSLASTGQTTPLNEARRYKEMSDTDFQKLANKNLGYF